MSEASSEVSIAELLNLHHILEVEHDDGNKGNFLFGWQCANPFAGDLLDATNKRQREFDRIPYTYLEEDVGLIDKIKSAHIALDGTSPLSVFCGAGATALLVTFAAYLKQNKVDEIYFIPPIYFSMHFAFRLLGIHARPVSGRHAFEETFSLNLPNKRAVLVLTDPIWYVGLPVPKAVIQEIAHWQKETGSIIMVDGSFQYMPWNLNVGERSALLDPTLTARLISPSKSLAVAGYRFAYILMPPSWRQSFSHVYTNVYASSSVDTIAFGYEAVAAMESRQLTDRLAVLASQRHQRLRNDGKLQSIIQATCGYFVFEKLNLDLPAGYAKMGGEYFDQLRYPGYTRINLLSPSFHLLE
ncbi:hypothetical protein BH11PSE4_BH11PSE4_38870 [soil metagenome]